jgi:hypothetical protein
VDDVPVPRLAAKFLFEVGVRVFFRLGLDDRGVIDDGIGFGVGRFGTTGVAIRVRGQTYPRGLAIHPPADATPARLIYDLDGGWTRFTAQAAINDTSDFVVQGRRGNHSPLVFVVLGDGRELWRSREINTGDAPQPFDVAITGVRRLELRVDIAGVFHCCQSVWLDPALSR